MSVFIFVFWYFPVTLGVFIFIFWYFPEVARVEVLHLGVYATSALYTRARISQSVRAPCLSRFIFTSNFLARVFRSFLSYGKMLREISSVSVYRKFRCGWFVFFSFENSLFRKLISNGAL